jgi:hypothetical protein
MLSKQLKMIVLSCFLLAATPMLGQCNELLQGIPASDGPLKVFFGFNLVNITDVNEKEETIDFDAEIILSWVDSRLAYDPEDYGMDEWMPGDYSKSPRQVYLNDFTVNEMFQGWWPSISMLNGVGNRVISSPAIGVYPDGRVIYTDSFFAKAETPMDLRRFPFDQQSLEIFFHASLYSRDEMVLIPSDHLARTWDQNMGLADWSRIGIETTERPVDLLVADGAKFQKSEVVVKIKLVRKPTHFLLSILFPMVLLVSLTWSVFWMQKESLSARVNIAFIGILSVVAYYFVFLDLVPEANYLTLVDAFILSTFLVLAANVVLFVVTDSLEQSGKESLAVRVDHICRWAFPLGYVLMTAVLAMIFLSL